MKLGDIINAAAEAYPDQFILNYWDEKKGKVKKGNGDGLAEFIAVEVAETFDADATDEVQVEVAVRVVRKASEDLTIVAEALEAFGLGVKHEED